MPDCFIEAMLYSSELNMIKFVTAPTAQGNDYALVVDVAR